MEAKTETRLNVESLAFTEGGSIPRKYTCDGENISPPLAWNALPDGTKSIAVIADDPDSPSGMWVHWVVFDIPPDVMSLPESTPARETLQNGAKQGVNSFGKMGYGGPCPPSGAHRYFFKVYALDDKLGLDARITKDQLVKAMEGHVLAEGQLMGRYSRR